MDSPSLGTGREIHKVLSYLRTGYLLKITQDNTGLALLIKPGDRVPAGTARYAVADFLRSAGVLEVVEDGWLSQVFRLRPDFTGLDQGMTVTGKANLGVYQAPTKLGLEQLRLFVRRKEHSNPMLDSVSRLLESLSLGASLNEIELLVRKDVELTMRIVRVAGAPAFGGRKVQSIRHAVELLGYDQLYSIVSTIALFSAATKPMLGPGLSKERFQRRSLLIALLSRTLAIRLGLQNEEGHFMAGLLQECGYLPIAKLLPDRLEQIVAVVNRTEVTDLLELEHYYLSFTHVDAGRAFGEEYHFCEPVLEAISHHHAPMFAKEECQVYADLGHLASWIADQLGVSAFEGCPQQQLDKYAAQRLNVDPSDLHSTFGAVHQTANATYELMSAG